MRLSASLEETMALSLRLLGIILFGFAYLACASASSNNNATGTHEVSAVALDNDAAFAVCVYPRSVCLARQRIVVMENES